MNWSPVHWDVPMFVKVPAVALAVCAAVAGVLVPFGLFIGWLNSMFGEDVAVITVLCILGFVIVCLFTWLVLEDY